MLCFNDQIIPGFPVAAGAACGGGCQPVFKGSRPGVPGQRQSREVPENPADKLIRMLQLYLHFGAIFLPLPPI